MTPVRSYLAGSRDQREAGDHVVVDDVVVLAAGDIGALAVEHAVAIAEIAVLRHGSLSSACVDEARRPGFRARRRRAPNRGRHRFSGVLISFCAYSSTPSSSQSVPRYSSCAST